MLLQSIQSVLLVDLIMDITTNTPVATIDGAGPVEIIARIQYPISRCAQLMRDINVFSFAINP